MQFQECFLLQSKNCLKIGETKKVKKYLKASKTGNFVQVLKALGIELSLDGLEKLEKTMQNREIIFNSKSKDEEER